MNGKPIITIVQTYFTKIASMSYNIVGMLCHNLFRSRAPDLTALVCKSRYVFLSVVVPCHVNTRSLDIQLKANDNKRHFITPVNWHLNQCSLRSYFEQKCSKKKVRLYRARTLKPTRSWNSLVIWRGIVPIECEREREQNNCSRKRPHWLLPEPIYSEVCAVFLLSTNHQVLSLHTFHK